MHPRDNIACDLNGNAGAAARDSLEMQNWAFIYKRLPTPETNAGG